MPWTTITSTIWSRTRITGLSAFMALWKTMEMPHQRKSSISSSLISRISRPAKFTLPPVISAGGCRMRKIECAMVVLPLPDSPASPTTSPSLTVKDTPSTALTGPRLVKYSTCKSRTSSRGWSGGRFANNRRCTFRGDADIFLRTLVISFSLLKRGLVISSMA